MKQSILLLVIVALIFLFAAYCVYTEKYNWSTTYQDICQSQIKQRVLGCQKEYGFGQNYLNCACKVGEKCASDNFNEIQTDCKKQLASEFKICDSQCLHCNKYTKEGKCRYICNPSSPLFSEEKCRQCIECNTIYNDNCHVFDEYEKNCNEDCDKCISNPCNDTINGPCSYDKTNRTKWTNIKNPQMCEMCKQYCTHKPFDCDVKSSGNYFR